MSGHDELCEWMDRIERRLDALEMGAGANLLYTDMLARGGETVVRQTMATLDEAVRQALENCDEWEGGAVVVQHDTGEYEACPGAYLCDISYTGSRDPVVTIDRLSDVTGDGRPWDDLSADGQEWVVAHLTS